jgi:peptidoglycan/LPS O-acetylase OafA/YrhL
MTVTPPGTRTFPTLNAVRAVGALGVVATHTAFDTGEILHGAHGAFLARLDFGVTLFFVLSGFLLGRPFVLAAAVGGAAPSTPHYLWKRALRILPLYWLTVVLALLLLPENRDLGLGDWLRNLTLTQLYTEGPLPAGLTQMWSLCTEVLFYLLLPVLAPLVLAWPLRGHADGWSAGRALVRLGVLAAVGLAWQVVAASSSNPTGEHYHQWLPGFLPWFAVGIAFAVVGARSGQPGASPRWLLLDRLGHDLLGCWVIGIAVFVLACTPLAGPLTLVEPTPLQAALKTSLYTLSAAMLLLPLVFGPEREGTVRRVAASRPAVWLGDISYGIFCLHLLVLEGVMSVLGVEEFEGDFVRVFLLTVAGTIAVSALAYYLLERPVMRLRNWGPFVPRTPAAAKASASTARS